MRVHLALLLGLLLVPGTLALSACGEPTPKAPHAPMPASAPPEVRLADLEDPHPAVRLAAARRLAEGAVPLEAVPALVGAVDDANRHVREWAIRALGRLGPAASPATPALTKALHDRDSFVRWRAAETLARIGPAAAAALPVLEESAASDDETELGRYWAREAVERIRGR